MFSTWGRTPSSWSQRQAAADSTTTTINVIDRRKGLGPLAVTLGLSWAQPGPNLTPGLCKALLCAFQRLGQLERLLFSSTGWQLCAKTCWAASPLSDGVVRGFKEKPLQRLCHSSWNKSRGGSLKLSVGDLWGLFFLIKAKCFHFINKYAMTRASKKSSYYPTVAKLIGRWSIFCIV